MEPTLEDAINALDELANSGNIEEEISFEDDNKPGKHGRTEYDWIYNDDNPRPNKFGRPNDDTDNTPLTTSNVGTGDCNCSCKKTCEEKALYNCKMAQGCKDNGCIKWYKSQRRKYSKPKRSYRRPYYSSYRRRSYRRYY